MKPNKIAEYIKENWDSLPHSKFDDLEVVVVKEIRNDAWGWRNHDYEGIAVNKDGKYMWVYSSGCSCYGGPLSQDADFKTLMIENPEIETIEPETINYQSMRVAFKSYE